MRTRREAYQHAWDQTVTLLGLVLLIDESVTRALCNHG